MAGGTVSGIEFILQNDGSVDALIYKGASITATVDIFNGTTTAAHRNLTGYKARMQGRKSYGGSIVFDFSSTASPATINIDSTGGKLTLSQTRATTSAWEVCSGVYDLFLLKNDGTDSDPIIRGRFKILPYVTTE